MDTSSRTSEKMRPILQAMERSVESARRRRLQVAEPFESVEARNGVSAGPLGQTVDARTRPQSSTALSGPGVAPLHSPDTRNGIPGNPIGIGRGHAPQHGQQPVLLPPLHPHPQHNGGGPAKLKAKPKRQFQSP